MSKRFTYIIIAILFIASGATGLIYQIAWFKYLSLFLGNTTYAQTIVLATFMGGLAIGASVWGPRADRTRSPILLYGALEFFIGVYCLLYPLLMTLVKSAFISSVRALQLPSDGQAVLLLKLVVSVLTLILPTILMGGTLPVLVRFLTHSVEESGKNVARLYYLNSFGAVVGSMLGGFFLVPMAGLRQTVFFAGAINILIAAVAFGLGTRKQLPSAQQEAIVDDEGPVVHDFQVLLAIAVAGASGLAAMIYEVAWVRLLIPVIGSSTHSYTLILVAFISGITIGSWLVSVFIQRWKNMVGALAVCQLLVGVSMALMLPLYGRVPYVFWYVGSLLTRSDAAYPFFLTVQFLVGFSIMIIPTVFLGMSLPIASRIATRSVRVLGRSVGTVFSVNTAGSVLGSLAAGLLLIPLLGVRHTMEVGLAVSLLCSIVLTVMDASASIVRRGKVVFTALVMASLTFVFGSDWNKIVTLSGVFRQFGNNRQPPASYEEFVQAARTTRAVYYKEGASATVGVVASPVDSFEQLILIINGKPDASSIGDLPTQVLAGQVPALLHPHLDSVLVIGFGSGATTGSVLTHPVKRVECVEISPEVIQASKFFEAVNNKPLNDPRTKVIVDDALSYLNLSFTNYDAIISEPSNPWIAGIGNLYTTDFFETCKKRLRSNGLMVQWIHLYEIDDATLRLVVRTFRSVFPHVLAWQCLGYDLLLVGSKDSVAFHEDQLVEKFSLPRVRRDLVRIRIPDPATFLSLQMISEGPLREYAGAGPLNTEDKPLLEYGAPRAFFVNRKATDITRFDERMAFGRSTLFLNQLLSRRSLSDEERLHIGLYHANLGRGNLSVGYSMLSEYLAAHPNDGRVLLALAGLADRLGRKEEQVRLLARAAAVYPENPSVLEQYASAKFTSDRSVASPFAPFDASVPEKSLQRCIELTADTVDYYHIKLADLYFGMQQYQRAFESYRKAFQLREKYPPDPRIPQDVLLLQLVKCFRHLGEAGKGVWLRVPGDQPESKE